MSAKLALFALVSACVLPHAAFAQEVAPLPGNEAAWAAEANCGPRIPLKPVAGISAPGLTVSPGNAEFKASFVGSGIDLEGVDTQVLGDGTTVSLSDVRLHHTGGGHILVTGYDSGGNNGGNPVLNVDHFVFDFAGAQGLSQGNLNVNYTAGATHSEIHLSHGCLRNAPSDYFSTFLGGVFTLTDSHVSAMGRMGKPENGDHSEAGHINGGKAIFKNDMFDMAADGGVPCCITAVLFFDAISTGYEIDATIDHSVIKGIQSQGFLYPIVLSPGRANVTLHICNTDIEPGIHGQYIAGVGPYGAFNAKVKDCGGNRNAATGEHILLGEPEAPPAPDPAPTPVDPRDAQIAALTTQLAQAAETATQLSAGLVSVTATSGRYASALGTVIVLGTADNAKRQGPTKADMAAVILTAKTALANH